jgi:hypothetical protein
MAHREKSSSFSIVSDLQENLNLPPMSGQESGTKPPDSADSGSGTASPDNGSGQGDPPEPTPSGPAVAAALRLARLPAHAVAGRDPPAEPEASGPQADPAPTSIPKPTKSKLDQFKTKVQPSQVEPRQGPLPHHKISEAKDFVRIHANRENYWSAELCFVSVPIRGQKEETLHLIDEDVAKRNDIPEGKIERFALALASKPYDHFFLAHIPTRNLDNSWNLSCMEGIESAQTWWTELVSLKKENKERYQVTPAKDNNAFPAPNWPKGYIDEYILASFEGRLVMDDDHPVILRLTGRPQKTS